MRASPSLPLGIKLFQLWAFAAYKLMNYYLVTATK